MPPLALEQSFIVTGVRRNNGVMDTLFSLPGGLPDEYISANLLMSRGVAKEGQRYKIIIVPEFPVEQGNTSMNDPNKPAEPKPTEPKPGEGK